MSGLTSTTKPGAYTEEILTKNFLAIEKSISNLLDRVTFIEDDVHGLYKEIDTIKEAVKTAKNVKTPSRVTPFVIGAVAGVVAYRYATRNSGKIKRFADRITEEGQSLGSPTNKNSATTKTYVDGFSS